MICFPPRTIRQENHNMYDLQIFCLEIHLSDGLEHHHNLQIIFFYFVVLACGCRFVDSGYTMICRPGFSVGSAVSRELAHNPQ